MTGDYRVEDLFVIKQELSLYEVYEKEITALDAESEKCLASFDPKTLDKPPTTIKKLKPPQNFRLFRSHPGSATGNYHLIYAEEKRN